MTDTPEWLPPLVLFGDYGGDWEQYVEAIYAYFKEDFIDNKLEFRGRRLGLKRHPLSNGKEATFWHLISEGIDEASRTPDLRRCERICWPRPVVENSEDNIVKVWTNVRRSTKGIETRICLWLETQEYLVILADRKTYILPWTAYVVDKPHQKRKLQKEFEDYQKNQG